MTRPVTADRGTRTQHRGATASQHADTSTDPAGKTIAYGCVESPCGPLWIAVGQRGILEIVIGGDEAALLATWRAASIALARDDERIRPVATQLAEYFQGTRRTFTLPVDLSRLSPFQQAVLQAVRDVPAGQLVSYSDLAARLGRPTAARAVGNALRANPIPIVVPCHRVVRRGGHLGGYTGGLDCKRFLLTLEGASLRE